MEEKIINYLQENVVDRWKEAIENDWNFDKEFYRDKWTHCRPMAEVLLGKEITIKKWKVVVE